MKETLKNNPEQVTKRHAGADAGSGSGSGMLGNDKDSAASHSRADVEELQQNSELLSHGQPQALTCRKTRRRHEEGSAMTDDVWGAR